MKSFTTEIKKLSTKNRLTASERRELRERVLSYLEYHPLRKATLPETVSSMPFSPSYRVVSFSFRSLYARVALGTLAAIVFVVVPLAAEQSVPGDVLYMVKTGINENIQSRLAESPYERVIFETKLIERRIAEARLLASEGKLTEAVEAKIVETVKGHAIAAREGIAELRTANADEAAIAEISFGSALEVQSAVLDEAASRDGKATSSQSIRDAVRLVRAEVASSSTETAPSFVGLMARVERETTRAYELFSAIKTSATEDEKTEIKRRLEDVDRKIIGARSGNETGSENATAELAGALNLTQKLIAFMTNIDVRTNVALETLVPVVRTTEERTDESRLTLNTVLELQKTLEERRLIIKDANIILKLDDGLAKITELIVGATTSLDEGKVDEVAGRLVEAFALAKDLDILTQPSALETGVGADKQEGGSANIESTQEVASSTTNQTTKPTVSTTTSSVSSSEDRILFPVL